MKIEKLIKKYRNIPFKYGGTETDGLDCIGFMYRFFVDQDIELPDSIGSINKKNYSELYLSDEDAADKLLIEYFDLMPGKEVNVMELLAGDALIMKSKKTGHLFPAIYGGNGIAITSFVASYVRAFTISDRIQVVKARRVL